MLVLTRKKTETIQIGDDVIVKVIRTGANHVKLGIDAPHYVRILRGELSDDIRLARKGDVLDWAPPEADSTTNCETPASNTQQMCLTRHVS
ncbi:MAG: hypothetical protein Tsb009_30980 [Planctomycetaceae bacterium]